MGTKIKRFQITNDAIDASKVKDSSILDADISSGADIQQSKVDNLEQDLNSKVNLSGDTLTGILTLNAAPTQPMHAATKKYVDDLTINLHPTDLELISFIESIGNTLTIGPYSVTVNGSAATNTSNTTIDLTNTSNFENNNTSTGVYYIYVTGSGVKLSTSLPVFINGKWKHSIQNWKPIGSIIKTSSGFIPFIKYNSTVLFKNYLILGSATASMTIQAPISATFALISIEVATSSTSSGSSVSASLSILDPDTLTTVDNINIAAAVGGSSYRAVAIQDRQNLVAPVLLNGSLVTIKTAGSGTVYQNGYMENF